ncbi:MAG: hypothetical protein Q9162_002289 [Coniocarpon cinnabarinum]
MSTLSPHSTLGPAPPTAAAATINTTPVYAAFSPTSSSDKTGHHRRTTLLVHQKSPLLVATPPQVTRALAYSHPFISPLSKFAGLLSWSTPDPWESFLLVAAFWAVVLYGDTILRTTGPLLFAAFLIFGMWSRRFSPLSSIGWAVSQRTVKDPARQHARKESQSASHHKSLDEILQSLQTLTTRCNILLEPLLDLTDFLSTQHTATTATTRPALTALFTRLLFVTPIWYALTLPPLRLITAKRIVLVVGTLFLSWHSRPARVSRIILWRSKSVRKAIALITGLSFQIDASNSSGTSSTSSAAGADRSAAAAAAQAARDGKPKEGIRFTFVLYENQRRWLGIGWTHSMMAYERAPWTDEYLNPSASKDDFELPAVQGGAAEWRWCEGSKWRIEDDSTNVEREAEKRKRAASSASRYSTTSRASEGELDPTDDDESWIYYNNKWQDGRRSVDGWGRYTRRRKWIRDAELVEITPTADITPTPSPRIRAKYADQKSTLPRVEDDNSSLLTPDRNAKSPNLVALPPSPGYDRGSDPMDSNGSAMSPIKTSTPQSLPVSPTKEYKSWFRRRRDKSHSRSSSLAPTVASTTGAASVTSEDGDAADGASMMSRSTRDEDDDGYVPMRTAIEKAWVGEDEERELG